MNFEGILCDLDGVLYQGSEPINGAVEAVRHIQNVVPIRFLSNTTTKTRKEVFSKLKSLGFNVHEEEIVTPITVAKEYLEEKGESVLSCVRENIRPSFEHLENTTNPDWILIGDIGHSWDYDLLNKLFQKLTEGAGIMALHKNGYGSDSDRNLKLDIGSFVAALEYASGKKSLVVGKPASTFFDLAIKDWNYDRSMILMVGDDIRSDIEGSMKVGMKSALVKTGKYNAELVKESGINPDFTIDSITGVPDLI